MEIYTIGYEGIDQDQFLSWLHHYGITIVADVRKIPLSRKKGFSKKHLASLLTQQGIEYINFQRLGAPKELRTELKSTGDYDRFFRSYKKTLSNHIDQLGEILSLINDGKKITLLCFEKDPQRCHRMVIAKEILKMDGDGLKVKHLRDL